LTHLEDALRVHAQLCQFYDDTEKVCFSPVCSSLKNKLFGCKIPEIIAFEGIK